MKTLLSICLSITSTTPAWAEYSREFTMGLEGVAASGRSALHDTSDGSAWTTAGRDFEGLLDSRSVVRAGRAAGGRVYASSGAGTGRGLRISAPPAPGRSGPAGGTQAKSAGKDDKKKADPSPPDKKAVAGAAAGILLGALIGFALGGPIGALAGAIIGVFIGAVAGKLLGRRQGSGG